MNIVWISRQDPRSSVGGANLYSRGLLDGLKTQDVSLEVFGCADHGARSEQGIFEPPRRWRPLSLLSTLQSDAWRLRSRAFAEAVLNAITPDTDAIVFDYFAMGWLIPHVRKRLEVLRTRPTIIYVSHNHEQSLRRMVAEGHKPPLKYVLMHDAGKAARLERKLVDFSDIVTSNTDADRDLFTAAAPRKVHVTLTPAYDGPLDIGPDLDENTPRRVVMMGSLEWIAKRESLRRFVAAAERPFLEAGIELVVVGRADPEFVESVQSRSRICRFTGFLDDPIDTLRAARIGLMPDELGGGFKHRFLHYIFRGVPVATISSQAAGLPFRPEEGMLTGANSAELVNAIVGSIDDLDRLNAMRRTAYEACSGKFDWAGRGETLVRAIKKARGQDFTNGSA